MILVMLVNTISPAWSNPIDAASDKGKTLAADILPQKDYYKGLESGGLTVPTVDENGNVSQKVESVDGYSGAEQFNKDSYTSAANSDASIISIGSQAQSSLANSQDTPSGKAYSLLVNTSQHGRKNLDNDPIWNGLEDVLDNADLVTQFTDCDSEVEVTTTTREIASTTEQFCERAVEFTPTCEVKHEIEGARSFLDGQSTGYPNGFTLAPPKVDTGVLRFTVGLQNSTYPLFPLATSGDQICGEATYSMPWNIGRPQDITMARVYSIYVTRLDKGGWVSISVGGENVFDSRTDSDYNVSEIQYFGFLGKRIYNTWDPKCLYRYDNGEVSALPCEDEFGYVKYYPVPKWIINYGDDPGDVGSYFNGPTDPFVSGVLSSPIKFNYAAPTPYVLGTNTQTYPYNTLCPMSDSLASFEACQCYSEGTNYIFGYFTDSVVCHFIEGPAAGQRVPVSDTVYGSRGPITLDYVKRSPLARLDRSNITQLFRAGGINNIIVQQGGGACASAVFDIWYERTDSTTVTKDEWYPQSCVDELNSVSDAVADGICEGQVECIDTFPVSTIDGKRATQINGVTIYEDDLADAPLSGIDKFCKQVKFNGSCNKQDDTAGCVKNDNGELECPNRSCADLAADPDCKITGSTCISYSEDGACEYWEDSYDCTTYTDVVDTQTVKENIICGGPIACLGNECMDDKGTKSDAFTKVASTLNAVDAMQQHGECDLSGDCRIFKGKMLECANGGQFAECCFNPNSSKASLSEYLSAYFVLQKADKVIMTLDNASMVRGAWSTLRDPVVHTWDKVSGLWHSAVENITGSAAKDVAVTEATNTFKQKLLEASYNFLADNFGQDVAGSIITSSGGTFAMNQTLSTALSTVFAVYTAYEAFKLAAALLNKCDNDDPELAARRKLKMCHKVDRRCTKRVKIAKTCIQRTHYFCCYDTPLARIVNEQAKKQGAIQDWQGRYDQCNGISIQEFVNIDWDQVDLSEWVDMLKVENQFPNAENISLESITGEGSTLDVSDSLERMNAYEKEVARTGGEAGADDLHKVHREIEGELWGSVIPQPVN